MTNDDTRPTPHEFIQRFGRLREAVAPLCMLADTNPALLPDILELAMVLAIQAVVQQSEHDAKFSLIDADLRRGVEQLYGYRWK